MRLFKIDLRRLIALLLPTFLRKHRLTYLLQAAIVPFEDVVTLFKINRDNNIYKINNNGQVCKLRAALNYEFDPSAKRITIEDVERHGWTMIYREIEEKPVWLGEKILWREDMIGSETTDFIVKVPFKLSSDQETRMRSVINYYKLVSKRYEIQKIL